MEYLILYRDKQLSVLHIGNTFLPKLRVKNTPQFTGLSGNHNSRITPLNCQPNMTLCG